jgi:acyl-CoA synthetase (AMP-forming)/AMP-acid ligase II
MHALGLKSGDAVVVQVPNWQEGAATLLACFHLGLIVVPVIPIYEAKELSFILREVDAKAIILPAAWRKFDFVGRVAALDSLPSLKHVIVIGQRDFGRPVVSWAQLTEHAPIETFCDFDANATCLINFTSGTTAAPKGVVHSHSSLTVEINAFPMERSKKDGYIFWFMPGGHIGGIIATLWPFLILEHTILIDHFDGELAIEAMHGRLVDRCTGAPVHLHYLFDHFKRAFPNGLSHLMIGGAGVPPTLIERAESLGVPATRSYGATEHPTISGGNAADSLARRALTDGQLLRSNSVRIVDSEGHDLPRGRAGEILSMGPELFKGYLDPGLNVEAFDSEGWFRTGDIGLLDDDGYLTIVDRKKDIIIRGGENISSKEVEDIVLRHPAVLEVAAVAYPDEIYGERVAVFVRVLNRAELTLEIIQAHFAAEGVARQKTPERLIYINEFPRNAAGKIVKPILREQIRAAANCGETNMGV